MEPQETFRQQPHTLPPSLPSRHRLEGHAHSSGKLGSGEAKSLPQVTNLGTREARGLRDQELRDPPVKGAPSLNLQPARTATVAETHDDITEYDPIQASLSERMVSPMGNDLRVTPCAAHVSTLDGAS